MKSLNTKIWEAKLAARIHDPAEKAFVLLNDPSGHEGGTVRTLKKQLFPDDFSQGIKSIVKKSDWWASAADRPQFPQDSKNRYAEWTQVDFATKGELIHPLSGKSFDLKNLGVDWRDAKAANLLHFQKLIHQDSKTGVVDWKKTTLAFWRFGQELGVKELQMLWELLPADTRVPDHSIWAHLDLCSAFAGAMAGDLKNTPALLTMSLGPVQSFIAQARSTSDLWAGSHLLSRLMWEGLKVICEKLGPDSVIFPQLRGIPCVDLWIEDVLGTWPKDMQKPDWKKDNTDSNPLFSAALPNRFMAIVPESQAEDLAQSIEQQVRLWVNQQAHVMLQALLAKVSMTEEEQDFAQAQIDRQFSGFPDVTWSVVPWSLVECTGKKLNTEALESASSPFFPEEKHGFLGSTAWEILSKKEEIEIEGCRFYNPNEGVLYPALYELLECSNAAAKSLRPFEQQHEQGYRCSLCGEREWISSSETHLFLPTGRRAENSTLWSQISEKQPSWARKGEHLCGICALKRLWPTLFLDDVKDFVPELKKLSRYVISTHTMALAPTLERWLKQDQPQSSLKMMFDGEEQVALPLKLARQLKGKSKAVQDFVKRMPAVLDRLHSEKDADAELEAIQREIKTTLGSLPEAYYAFIKLDGDKMGAWLSGSEKVYQLSYENSWHSQIRENAKSKLEDSGSHYLNEKRWSSPARHAAISDSLNSFALHLTRYVIEDLHQGKLLYAGGDDVMAMVSIEDLLSAMLMLRLVYSGSLPHEDSELLSVFSEEPDLKFAQGFVLWKKKLYRMMGDKATASAGAVIAHYSTPLALVKRELDQAESEAKNKGGRDAFSLRVLKRAGGQVSITSKWFASEKESSLHPITALMKMTRILGSKHLSRRAAYHVQDWLRQLPKPEGINAKGKKQEGMDSQAYERMLIANIRRQFKQQGGHEEDLQEAEHCARIAIQQGGCDVSGWLEGFLGVAEFLGRREFEQRETPKKEHDHE